MAFHSNRELVEAVENLQKDLASSGNEEADKLITEGIRGLNGLTDGWAYLLESLEAIKQKHGAKFSRQQNAAFDLIIGTVKKIVYRE
jgi:hypothetical protein